MRGFAQVKYKKLGETEALLAEGDPKGKHLRTGAVFPYAFTPPCLRPRRKAIVDGAWLIG